MVLFLNLSKRSKNFKDKGISQWPHREPKAMKVFLVKIFVDMILSNGVNYTLIHKKF